VVFTPWQLEEWDENDTLSDAGNLWYAARQASATPTPEQEDQDAATRAWEHRETPTTVHLDSLGRAFLVVADNGNDELFETRSVLDLEGQVRSILDALDRTCMSYDYAVDGQLIHQSSIDAGETWGLLNVLGTPRSWDEVGHATWTEVDALERVTHLWVQKDADPETLALRVLYGESYTSPETNNLRGRVCLMFDGAGLLEAAEYDFKGNALSTSRKLATTHTEEPNWLDVATATTPAQALSQAASLVETEAFTKAFAYDALSRVTAATMPDGSELKPTYNEAGFVEAIEVWIQSASAWTAFVTNIDYDEKGRRTRIDYENGTYTEYFYDPLTFRLTRLRTTRSADSKRLQDLFYFYDPVGNITTVRDEAHEDVFYNDQQVTPTQDFVYDPLYRLIEATGREHAGGVGDDQRDQNDLPLWDLPHPNNAQALRRYTEEYTYDAVGNLLAFFHDAGSGPMTWTRQYKYGNGSSGYANNRLHSTSLPGDDPNGSYSATYTHDDNGNMTSMPHLTSIAYTHANQMRMADLGGGGDAYYTYDASGERVLKRIERIGTLVEERIYLGGYEVYRKRDHTGLLFERQTLHVMDGARRIAMVETVTVDTANPSGTGVSRIRYQYTNHLDSAMVECDDTGQVISYEEYHPYGTTAYRSARAGVEVSERRYRYTGKERDDETGLGYHGARYYALWLGRWTSADPAGIVDGPGLYTYVGSNPVVFHDPSGNWGLAFMEKMKALQKAVGDIGEQVKQPVSTAIEIVGGVAEQSFSRHPIVEANNAFDKLIEAADVAIETGDLRPLVAATPPGRLVKGVQDVVELAKQKGAGGVLEAVNPLTQVEPELEKAKDAWATGQVDEAAKHTTKALQAVGDTAAIAYGGARALQGAAKGLSRGLKGLAARKAPLRAPAVTPEGVAVPGAAAAEGGAASPTPGVSLSKGGNAARGGSTARLDDARQAGARIGQTLTEEGTRMKEIARQVGQLGLPAEEAAAAVQAAVKALPGSRMTSFIQKVGENIVVAPYMEKTQRVLVVGSTGAVSFGKADIVQQGLKWMVTNLRGS
jgi:RHS repeat-associated protein